MIEAIRQSDLLLMHLIDRKQMVEWLGEVETLEEDSNRHPLPEPMH